MSKNLTGTYTIRPTTYIGYISSGTFSNYFDTSVKSAPSSWTNSFSSRTNTCLSDNRDSTYLTMDVPSALTSGIAYKGYNATFSPKKVSGILPPYDYTITQVSVTFKLAADANGTANSDLVGHVSVSNASTTTYPYKFSAEHTGGTTKTNYTKTSSTTTTMTGGTMPSRIAVCLAGGRKYLSSVSWFRMYEVTVTITWRVVCYSYKAYVDSNITGFSMSQDDSGGVFFTSEETASDTPSALTTDDVVFRRWNFYGPKGATSAITATLAPGYYFDGVYPSLFDQVASDGLYETMDAIFTDNPFELTFPSEDDDESYLIGTTFGRCINGSDFTRRIFISPGVMYEYEPLNEYAPLNEAVMVYRGSTKIWQRNISVVLWRAIIELSAELSSLEPSS